MVKHIADQIVWLRKQIAEDEWWATEASRKEEEPLAEGGEHWQWSCRHHDEPAVIDPMALQHLECTQECWEFYLHSREEYPYGSFPGVGPHIVIYADETSTVVAGHIVRWDPARVLRENAARRQRLAIIEEALLSGQDSYDLAAELFPRELAAYAERDGYDPEIQW